MVYISACSDNGIIRTDDNGKEVVCNGYYCQVYTDENMEEQIDDFCLAIGFELKDNTDKELIEVLREKRKEYEDGIPELWSAACNGIIEPFESNKSKINCRYTAFGREHSFIMGALRNNQFDMVEYLISNGATVTEEEMEEIVQELKVLEWKRILSNME